MNVRILFWLFVSLPLAALTGCGDDFNLGRKKELGESSDPARIDCNDGDNNSGLGLPELRDGRDNDCDGRVDEGFENAGQPCETGVGACHRMGVMGPTADLLALECEGADGLPLQPGAPVAETCDSVDNDCDGTVDEDFGPEGNNTIGGVCNLGDGDCAAQGVRACNAQGAVVCNAPAGPPPQAELCDGRDNDCDGQTDETFPTLGEACNAGQGACLTAGELVCNAQLNGVVCDAVAGQPVANELCNGIDDDCDGQSDEDFNLDEACDVGLGACMVQGERVCNPANLSGAALCVGQPLAPGEETCNNIDDDCDGQSDEDFNVGEDCTFGQGECAQPGIVVCPPNGGMNALCIPNDDPIAPQNERCDGDDNDCDGRTDEGFNVGGACTVGVGACQRPGAFVCNNQGAVECSGQPGNPVTEAFDGIDNDCNGSIDDNVLCGESANEDENDAACRAPCLADRTCLNPNWVCRDFRQQADGLPAHNYSACVSPRLPASHIHVCQVPGSEAPGDDRVCTTCLDRDGDGQCNPAEWFCADGFDSDGDTLTDDDDLDCSEPPAELCNARDDNGDGNVDEGNNLCPRGQVCQLGRCTLPLECEEDADCDVGEECNNGTCDPIPGFCRLVVDCPQGWSCTNNRCVQPPPPPPAECAENADCGVGEVCDDGDCRVALCPADFACAAGQNCVGGICVAAPPPPPPAAIRVRMTCGADCQPHLIHGGLTTADGDDIIEIGPEANSSEFIVEMNGVEACTRASGLEIWARVARNLNAAMPYYSCDAGAPSLETLVVETSINGAAWARIPRQYVQHQHACGGAAPGNIFVPRAALGCGPWQR